MATTQASSSTTIGPRVQVRLETVRVQGFRGLLDVCLRLEPDLTLFIGENNTGKTSVLEALAASFAGRPTTEDDLHLAANGTRSPSFTVDITILPVASESFDRDATALLGAAVRRAGTQEFAAIRTVGEPAVDRGGLALRRSFLDGWSGCESAPAEAVEMPQPSVNRQVLDMIAYSLLDAGRDLVDDLRNRRTPWGRLIADVDIDDALRVEVEDALRQIGTKLVDGSSVLDRVRGDLAKVRQALGATVSDVALAPLPARVEELARAIDIVVSAPAGAAIPLRLQGLGSRSLAALMVFHAFVEVRQGAGRALPPHAITGFEEPEAHLHPQAQRAVIRLVKAMPGQKLVSTHSPQVVSASEIRSIRRFARRAGAANVAAPKSPLGGAELVDLEKRVLRAHPEVMFAKAVLIVEGDAEDAAVPVFASAYWQEDPPEGFGLSIVNARGMGSAGPLVQVLEDLEIGWILLADGDTQGQRDVAGIGQKLGRQLDSSSSEVVMLPTGMDFEAYLISENLRPSIERGIEACYGGDALPKFRADLDGKPYSGNRGNRDYTSTGWEERLVTDFLRNNKGTYGAAIAEAIAAEVDVNDHPTIPQKVREAFDRISQTLTAQ